MSCQWRAAYGVNLMGMETRSKSSTSAAEKEGEHPRTVPTEGMGQESNVVIVEADATLADVIGELLDHAGIRSVAIASVQSMVVRWRPSRVRGVILDVDTVSLNWRDGSLDQFSTWLRVSPHSIPLLFTSVRVPPDQPAEWLSCLPSGTPVRWIIKPFSNQELLAAVTDMLR